MISPKQALITSFNIQTEDGNNLTEAYMEHFNIRELRQRRLVPVSTMLPDFETWERAWTQRNRRRLLFLMILWFLLAAINLGHIGILLVTLFNRLRIQKWIASHQLPTVLEDTRADSMHYETDCVAIYPEFLENEDWYLLDFLPYASLPKKRAVFAKAKPISTFRECYNAFWLGVHPSKRQFVHGQLRFLGRSSPLSCIQIGRNGVRESASVANCLTLSFRFRLRGATDYTGIEKSKDSTPPRAIVAYVGGESLLTHRPRLIGVEVADELDVLYMVIRYRLGVFGFGDFGLSEYGPNRAVEDVRLALHWIHANARLFGGDPSDMTLIGEASGASLALAIMHDRVISKDDANGTQPYLISKLWLHDGGLIVPQIPPEKRPFHALVLGNFDLLASCLNWQKANADRIQSGGGSSTLESRALCLEESIAEIDWLQHTPLEWVHADDRMSFLPNKEETSLGSLIISDPHVSQVGSPFESVSSARDMPIVWFSTLQPYHTSSYQNLSLADYKKLVKYTFAEFTAGNTEHNYPAEMLSAYEPMQKELESGGKDADFSPIIGSMITDLRSACSVHLYLTKLFQHQGNRNGPIYRVLSTAKEPELRERSTQRMYDVPGFLLDDLSKRKKRAGEAYPHELLRSMLRDFVHRGSVKGLKRMRYPEGPAEEDIETTVNIMGPVGTTTGGPRVMAHFAACRAWVSQKGDTHFATAHGRLN